MQADQHTISRTLCLFSFTTVAKCLMEKHICVSINILTLWGLLSENFVGQFPWVYPQRALRRMRQVGTTENWPVYLKHQYLCRFSVYLTDMAKLTKLKMTWLMYKVKTTLLHTVWTRERIAYNGAYYGQDFYRLVHCVCSCYSVTGDCHGWIVRLYFPLSETEFFSSAKGLLRWNKLKTNL